MKKAAILFLPFVSAAFLPLGAMDALIDVSNIRVTQNPSSRDVTVTYDLAETTRDNRPLAGAVIRLDVLTNSCTEAGYVSIGNEHIRTVTGDYSQEANSAGTAGIIMPGPNKRMVWNARKDFPDMRLEDVKFAVKAYYPGELVFDSWKYLFVTVGQDSAVVNSYSWCLTDKTPGEASDASWKIDAMDIWFVLCPKGEFMMGSPNDAWAHQAGRLLHKVTLTEPFFMQIEPIKTYSYNRIVNQNSGSGANLCKVGLSVNTIMGPDWHSTGEFGADSMVGKLRARSGLNFNLPTEAQWEYACRAGRKGTFNGTDEFFTEADSAKAYYADVYGVAHKYWSSASAWNSRTNAWGIAGMHTTIANWCRDTYAALTTDDAVDPLVTGGSWHILRGLWRWGGEGTCFDLPYNTGLAPSFGDDYIGARLVILP